MRIHATDPQNAVVLAMRDVLEYGTTSSPRGQDTVELIGASIKIDNPSPFIFDIEGRDLKQGIGILEGLQLIAQTSLPSVMTSQFKVFSRWTDGSVFDGAYGVRAHGMVRRVVEQLELDADSRQAVITIFDSNRDLGARTSDVPCTLSLQFLLRDDYLHMITTMRSNDVWRGLPYDLMQFIMLQHVIADHFEVDIGTYTHNVGSLHMYDSDIAAAEPVLQSGGAGDAFDVPRKLFSGNFYSDSVRRAEQMLLYAADYARPVMLGRMTLFEGYVLALMTENSP